jgi:hypothetical protein
MRMHFWLEVAFFAASEQVLELDHARVGEHQRRVVLGNDGAALHHLVAVTSKEA